MCGFVGAFGKDNALRDEHLFEVGASARHRGPDDTGFWADDTCKILFNRLAIIELTEAGRQPMCIRNWVIAFNGEIYNHLDIRKKLPAFNYRGGSDTETLCFAIENWGVERALSELNGMFAIAAYNKIEKTLSLARDFAGIKPLFYSIGSGTIWFASQFNQVANGIGKDRLSINPNGMRDLLQLGYMQAPETVYKEIRQVTPGEIISFDVRRRKTHKRYHQLSRNGFRREPAGSNDSQSFDELMAETVRDQLVSDVPIGCFISSGIDSALISGFASKVNGKVKTFTIGVNGMPGDERAKAKEYSQALGLEHESQEIQADQILNSVDYSIRLAGEPFGDPSSVPTFLITKGAKTHNTVMLSGDGGDELFWGYPRWNTFLQNYGRFRFPRQVRRIQRYLNSKRGLYLQYGPGMFTTPGEWVLNGHSHNGIYFLDKLMPGSQNTHYVTELYEFSFGPAQLEFRDWLRWNEFYGHLQRVLTKVDRMSMANSLEVRVPYLDKRIIEFAWNKKSSFGERHFINKKFLKQQLSRFIPEKHINHQKLGFDIPLENWLRGPLQDVVKDHLLCSPFYGGEFIDKQILHKYVKDFYTNCHNSAWGLWILFCWQKWGEYIGQPHTSGRNVRLNVLSIATN